MSVSIDYQNEPQQSVAPFLANRLRQLLSRGNRVLWLLSGGSGIQVCVETSRLLADIDISNLFVTVSDERYGVIGHPDENMQQLIDAGLSLPHATIYRPLTGKSIEKAADDFSDWLDTAAISADYRIALLGVGEDGHTSGVKPHSPAVHSDRPACSFSGEDYPRITTTTSFLTTFDEAVVQAYGPQKQSVVRSLVNNTDTTLDDFPAGLIRSIPKVTLFTDINKEDIV